jgi:phage terminase large subunit
MRVELPAHGWRPRHYQEPLWRYLEGGGKRAVSLWHRRSGKDEVALHWTASAAMQRIGNYWTMLPEASQARKAMWEAVNPHTGRRRIDDVFPGELRANVRNDEMSIRFKNGSTWQLVGSDNFDSLVGSTPVGMVFSEYALADPRSWAMLRPILAENGGWAIFPSTPRGTNHLKALYDAATTDPDWFAQRLTVEDTGLFDAAFLARELAEYQRENGQEDGKRLFEQEYHCSFAAAVRGAYYAAYIEKARDEKRIGRVPHDPKREVRTAWDLGIGDSTAIWFFQRSGREVWLIDYYEASGVGLEHYVNLMRSKPYTYADTAAILPHDAEAKELGTGKSRQEVLKGLGVKSEIAPRLGVDDGINAVRMMLPLVYIDAEKCARGIECLESYRADYDDKRKVLRASPLHNWSSHGADALRYLAVAIRQRDSVGRGGYRRQERARRFVV